MVGVGVIPVVVSTCLALVPVGDEPASQLDPGRLLVVYHGADDESGKLARAYAQHYELGDDQLFALPQATPSAARVSRRVFDTHIRAPIERHLRDPSRSDRFKILVLVRGVPWIIADKDEEGTAAASVDAELTQLSTGLVPPEGQPGGIPNPLLESYSGSEVLPLPRISHLVFRFDPMLQGAIVAADDLIARGKAGSTDGRVSIRSVDDAVDAETLVRVRARVIAELGLGEQKSADPQPVLAAWNPSVDTRYLPGGVAILGSHEGSTDKPDWQPFSRAVRQGACFVCGTVSGEDVGGQVKPDVFLSRFFQGVPAGLAAYQALPQLSRTTVFLGDPLLVSKTLRTLPPQLTIDDAPLLQAGSVGADLLIKGHHFTSRSDMTVFVGGRALDNFTVVDPRTLRLQVPPLSSGVHEIKVKTFMGEAEDHRGIVAWPALEIVGATGRGLPVDLAMYGREGDKYQVFMAERLARQELEPYGTLFLDPDASFQKLLTGTLKSPREEHLGVVPRVEQYHGRVIYLQALVGDREAGTARLTNVLRVRFH